MLKRKLTRSNEHFRNAVTKLPLGVASNFRYWGDDKTIYVARGKGGRMSNMVMWGKELDDWRPGQPEPAIEPFGAGITASAQYMKDVREICDRYDVLLIIDEVKTGFRVAKGGVQELYGIKADLCTFAKAIGNGYPLSVVAGREDVMRHIGDGVVHGGTFTAHSVSLAAAAKTLEILDETTALADIESYGLKLQAGMSRILGDRDIAHSFTGAPALMGLFFADKPPSDYRQWVHSDYEFYDTLAPELHEQGIMVEPDSREPWFLCESHNVGCLNETLDKFERAVDITLPKLESRTVRGTAGGPKNP